MSTKKIQGIGLMLAGAIIFIGGIFLFMTIYATINEPTTLRGMIGLSTIGLQPWLSAVLCLTVIILSITGLVRFVSSGPSNP